jgi:hypothetical protein
MKTSYFGFFDYFLGFCTLAMNKRAYAQYDKIVAKTQPEKQIS